MSSSSRNRDKSSISLVLGSAASGITAGKFCNSRAENQKSSLDLIKSRPAGTAAAFKKRVHATFLQKVLICAFAGFLAASLVEWAKVFVEGADDALNKGYKHRAVLDTGK